MSSLNRKLLFYLVPFGVCIYMLDIFCVPTLGMTVCSIISGLLVLILFYIYLLASNRESDERERLLRLQADSAALYCVIASLLAATIFFPHSEFAMVFWSAVGLVTFSRIITFMYQHYK